MVVIHAQTFFLPTNKAAIVLFLESPLVLFFRNSVEPFSLVARGSILWLLFCRTGQAVRRFTARGSSIASKHSEGKPLLTGGTPFFLVVEFTLTSAHLEKPPYGKILQKSERRPRRSVASRRWFPVSTPR